MEKFIINSNSLQETCFYTLILFIFCLFFSFIIYTQGVNIANSAKVEAEILDTYQEFDKYDYDIEDEKKYGITNYMTVKYNYENKDYITDVVIITRLGKLKGKKITVYIDKSQPNMVYNRASYVLMVIFTLIMWFATGSMLLEIITCYSKQQSDKRLRKMIDNMN